MMCTGDDAEDLASRARAAVTIDDNHLDAAELWELVPDHAEAWRQLAEWEAQVRAGVVQATARDCMRAQACRERLLLEQARDKT